MKWSESKKDYVDLSYGPEAINPKRLSEGARAMLVYYGVEDRLGRIRCESGTGFRGNKRI